MNYRYVLLESTCNEYKEFGIAAICEQDGIEVIFDSFSNLLLNKQLMLGFVNLCNSKKLSLCHLYDAVIDFIAEM